MEFKLLSYDKEKESLKLSVDIQDDYNMIHSIEDHEQNLFRDEGILGKLNITLQMDGGFALIVNLRETASGGGKTPQNPGIPR